MRKITFLLLVCFFTSIQVFGQMTEKERKEKIAETEKQVEIFIEENLDDPLPELLRQNLIKNYEQEFGEDFTSLAKSEQQYEIRKIKESYLRNLYFKKNTSATEPYQSSVNTSENFDREVCLFLESFENYDTTADLLINTHSLTIAKYDYGECSPVYLWENPGNIGDNLNEFMLTNVADDPIVGSALNQVNSEDHAIRINSPECYPGGRAVTFSKSFPANGSLQTIKFSYAIVAEHPYSQNNEHLDENPIFRVRALNDSGEELDSFCVMTNPDNNPFFNVIGEAQDPCPNGTNNKTVWTDWNCASLVVIGEPKERITIEFLATGCGQTGHFGYAYIDDISCGTCGETATGSLDLPDFSPCEPLSTNFVVDHTPPFLNGQTGIFSSAELILWQGNNQVGTIPFSSEENGQISFNINDNYFTGLSGGFDFEVQVSYSLDGGTHTNSEKHTTPGEDNDFFYESGNCCESFDDAGFNIALTLESEIKVGNYNTYGSQNAVHEWYVLSSPNPNAGPYTPENSLISSNNEVVVLTNPEDNLYYTVFHKVISDCGEICDKGWIASDQPSIPTNQTDSQLDCCMIYEYWPNGPGSEGTELDASFSSTATDIPNGPFTIAATATADYSSNTSISQQWILLSSPNDTGGPYTTVDIDFGPTYSSPDLDSQLHYYLVQKVNIEDCDNIEACYSRKHQMDDSGGFSRITTSNFDCSDLPECAELEAPVVNATGPNSFNWNTVAGAVEYKVFIRTVTQTSNGFWVSNSQVTTNNNYIFFVSNENTTRCISVSAVCNDGSFSSKSRQVCPNRIPALRTTSDNTFITIDANISPNPSNGSFSVELESSYSTKVSMSLRNYQGIAIEQRKADLEAGTRETFDWQNAGLPAGLYFIIIETKKEQKTLKLVIE